jgi:hypothetical protein
VSTQLKRVEDVRYLPWWWSLLYRSLCESESTQSDSITEYLKNSALSAYIHRTWPNPYWDLSPISKRTNAHKDKSYSREYVVVLTVDVFRQWGLCNPLNPKFHRCVPNNRRLHVLPLCVIHARAAPMRGEHDVGIHDAPRPSIWCGHVSTTMNKHQARTRDSGTDIGRTKYIMIFEFIGS